MFNLKRNTECEKRSAPYECLKATVQIRVITDKVANFAISKYVHYATEDYSFPAAAQYFCSHSLTRVDSKYNRMQLQFCGRTSAAEKIGLPSLQPRATVLLCHIP